MSPVNAIIFLPLVAVGLLPSAGVVSQGESLLLSAIALVVAFASPRALAWMRPESAVVRPIAVGPREQRVMARLCLGDVRSDGGDRRPGRGRRDQYGDGSRDSGDDHPPQSCGEYGLVRRHDTRPGRAPARRLVPPDRRIDRDTVAVWPAGPRSEFAKEASPEPGNTVAELAACAI